MASQRRVRGKNSWEEAVETGRVSWSITERRKEVRIELRPEQALPERQPLLLTNDSSLLSEPLKKEDKL